MSDLYLIVKRGLYYRPNSCGYTGIKDEAGRYSLAEVAERFPNTDSANQDGITFVAEADAPDYSEACYWDTKLKHQHEKAQAEITRLTSALAASEEARRAERAAVVRECAETTEEDRAKLYERAYGLMHQHMRGARGQLVTEQDGTEYWMCRAWSERILALATDADNAALDKLLREARKEGIAACVEAFHAEQTEIWAQEILEHLSIFNLLNIETYEDKISASEAVKKELRDIARILAALEAPPPPTAIAEGRT